MTKTQQAAAGAASLLREILAEVEAGTLRAESARCRAILARMEGAADALEIVAAPSGQIQPIAASTEGAHR